MLNMLKKIMIKPIKKFLRDEIDFYSSCINDCNDYVKVLKDEKTKDFYTKKINTYMDKRSEALYILDWICKNF